MNKIFNNSKRKKILILVKRNYETDALKPLINILSTQDYEIGLIDNQINPKNSLQEWLNKNKLNHLEVFKIRKENEILSLFIEDLNKYLSSVEILFKRNIFIELLLDLIRSIPYTLQLFIMRFRYRKLFKNFKPNAIIIQREREIDSENIILKEAKLFKIKVFCIPNGYLNTMYSISNRWGDKKCILNKKKSSIIHLIQNFFNSTHLLKYKDEVYSFLPTYKSISTFFAGLYLPNPWVSAGNSNISFLDSEQTKLNLVKSGIKEKKLIVSGNIYLDKLFISKIDQIKLKEKISKKYCLDNKNSILLICLPHLMEHKIFEESKHWAEIDHIVNSSKEIYNDNVIFSLHPRCDKLIYFERYPNCKFIDERLINILPSIDLFATYWSSTSVWGPLLKKPTLIFDWYGIDNLYYEYLNEYIIKASIKDKLINNFSDLSKLKSSNIKTIPGWPKDGKSCERILDVITNEISF